MLILSNINLIFLVPISCLQWPAFQEFMAYWPGALWIYCKSEPSGAEANTSESEEYYEDASCSATFTYRHTRLRRATGTAPWRRAADLISESISVGWRDRQSCWVHNTYLISVSWGHCVSIRHSLVTSSGPTVQSLRLKQTKHSEAQHFPWLECEDIPFISLSHIP